MPHLPPVVTVDDLAAVIDEEEAASVNAQIETGTPFMLYKDACNGKSNQKHLGTITIRHFQLP